MDNSPTMPKDYELDGKDRKILEILGQNSRLSIRGISSKSGIRPSTVHQRMLRMVKAGVIERFTIKVPDEKLGEPFTVFMLVSGTSERYLDKKFLKNKYLKEVSGVTGEYDVIMKLKFADLNEFNKFLIDFRERYSTSLTKTLTMVETVRIKEP